VNIDGQQKFLICSCSILMLGDDLMIPTDTKFKAKLVESMQTASCNDRVPLPKSIDFTELVDPAHVLMTMRWEATIANMQSNEAAFEAWALALKLWAGVSHVCLRWEVPQGRPASRNPTKEKPMYEDVGHYQRFLYRVNAFGELFDWFSIHETNLVIASRNH
jgi:hypothetical protein